MKKSHQKHSPLLRLLKKPRLLQLMILPLYQMPLPHQQLKLPPLLLKEKLLLLRLKEKQLPLKVLRFLQLKLQQRKEKSHLLKDLKCLPLVPTQLCLSSPLRKLQPQAKQQEFEQIADRKSVV